MKAVKFLFKFILWIVAIVVALVLTLPLWVGPVVRTAANSIVPKKTGTAFNLGAFSLNPYTGKLAVGNVLLGNPAGFDRKMAVALGTFDVSVDMGTVAGDTIVVRDIVLKDVFVSYVMNSKGENNFSVIAKNAKGEGGEKVKVRGEGEGKVKVRGEGEGKVRGEQRSGNPSTSKTSKKVIIDHLLIGNVVVQLGPIPVPTPLNIELKGIGRKSNGVTMAEAWEQISAQVMQNLNALGVNVNDLVKNIGGVSAEQAMKTLDAANKAAEAVKKGDARAISESVKTLSDSATKMLEGAGKGTGKSAEAVNKGASKAVEGVNKHIDKAADAVNAIKGLF